MLNCRKNFGVREAVPWQLSPRLNAIVGVAGVLILVLAPFWLHELFGIYEEYMPISFFAAAATVALIVIVNYSLILHCTRRHPALRRLMLVGMLAKVAAAGLYISMVVRLYNYVADLSHYFWTATSFTITYQQTGILTVPDPLFGVNFPPFLAQCIFIATGISLP